MPKPMMRELTTYGPSWTMKEMGPAVAQLEKCGSAQISAWS